MPKHRFYVDPEAWDGDALTLAGEEAHHCRDVMRCREGERLVLFNGRGSEADVEITGLVGQTIQLRTWAITQTERPPARLTLGQAVPKGKNMDLIIQKATELGASRIVPILSARTVVRLEGDERIRKQEKWQRVAIEACKQCGQNWVPEVAAPMTIETFLAEVGIDDEGELRLVASLSAESSPLKEILSDREERPRNATVLIGPEGDFTPAELAQVSNADCSPERDRRDLRAQCPRARVDVIRKAGSAAARFGHSRRPPCRRLRLPRCWRRPLSRT